MPLFEIALRVIDQRNMLVVVEYLRNLNAIIVFNIVQDSRIFANFKWLGAVPYSSIAYFTTWLTRTTAPRVATLH